MKTKEKIIEEYQAKVFKAIFGFELWTEPINGLIVAEEKKMDNELNNYQMVIKLTLPIFRKLLSQQKQEIVEEIEDRMSFPDTVQEYLLNLKQK